MTVIWDQLNWLRPGVSAQTRRHYEFVVFACLLISVFSVLNIRLSRPAPSNTLPSSARRVGTAYRTDSGPFVLVIRRAPVQHHADEFLVLGMGGDLVHDPVEEVPKDERRL